MKTNLAFAFAKRKTGLCLAVGLPALLVVLPLICAGRGGMPRGASAPRAAAAPRAVAVDRTSHGSIRHVDTHVVQRPVAVQHPVVEHPVVTHPEPAHVVDVRHEPAPRRPDIVAHRDVDVDIHRHRFWNDFAFGHRLTVLPVGYLALQIGGVPYDYCDGIYYQPADGGYQEVYPPVGAEVPQPPDGAIEVEAGGLTYYYAGGAFYLEQPDGTYAIAPTPMGVVVPELPPGAVQVSVKGNVAYQFNGIYYEPVFVNGVTQYETFAP
jgi:Family of unknown function (DUF6515)